MSSGGLKISTRYLTQRPVANQRRLPHKSTQSADLRQRRKGHWWTARRAAEHWAKHLSAQETEAQAHGRFCFFFSSFLPSSSHRRPTTSFPRNGVTFRSNTTARRRDEHKVSFFFFSFRWVVECDLFLSAVFVHMNDRQERGCVHVTTDHGAQADQFCTTARTEMFWDCVRV